MYGTCETLCRELAVKYPGDMPLMLVIWSPEEIQALADGMDISLSDHEIRTVLARLEDIPEDQRTESGISSGVAMEIINNVSENRQVTVPAELLASLIQTAEQALWKREWAARDHGLAGVEHLLDLVGGDGEAIRVVGLQVGRADDAHGVVGHENVAVGGPHAAVDD